MNDLITISFYVIYDSNLSTGILILLAFHKTHRSKSVPLEYWWLSEFCFILAYGLDTKTVSM